MPSRSTLHAEAPTRQQFAHVLGLPQGEAALAGGDDDGPAWLIGAVASCRPAGPFVNPRCGNAIARARRAIPRDAHSPAEPHDAIRHAPL
jgi:hypothetical protein